MAWLGSTDVSIRVEPAAVGALVEGTWAYVMTAGPDGAHVVALRPEVRAGGHLRVEVGAGRAGRNIGGGSLVTLVFPPCDGWPHVGYSLVVDARPLPTDIAGVVDLECLGAVWHRPAP